MAGVLITGVQRTELCYDDRGITADVPGARILKLDHFVSTARRFLGTILLGLEWGTFFVSHQNFEEG